MRVHVVGAGMAGLACALRAARAGLPVSLYEATANAGGRCRSLDDPALGRIDNGTHLFLGANAAVFQYLSEIGAQDRLTGVAPARFPFIDLTSGRTWTLRPNAGPVPWWTARPDRRVAGTKAHHYLAVWRLLRASRSATVTDAIGTSPLYDRLWRPLCEAVLNTEPANASASLLGKVIAATLVRGEAASRPYFATASLADAFVAPAVAALEALGVDMRFRQLLRSIGFADRVHCLNFQHGTVPVAPGDRVVLAVPWWAAARLLPWLPHLPSRAIVNAHFRLPATSPAPALQMLGAVGGTAQWVLVRDGVLTVTVSAADGLAGEDREALARRLWREAASALSIAHPLPPTWRIVREGRATLAHTPAVVAARPAVRTPLPNLLLAGDWTATGWPCTVEGAVQSGHHAADLLASGL